MNKDNPIDAYIFDKWEKELQGAVVLNNCERSLTKAAFLFLGAGIASILLAKGAHSMRVNGEKALMYEMLSDKDLVHLFEVEVNK